MTQHRVAIKDIVQGALKSLGKTELDRIKTRAITIGKISAISLACNLVQQRTGIKREICQSVATVLVNTLIREIKSKITS